MEWRQGERKTLSLFSVSSSMIDNKLFAKMLECTPQRWRNWYSNPYNVHTKKGKNGPKKSLLMWFVRHKSNSVSLVKTYYLTDMCVQMMKSCCTGKSDWILLFCHTNQLQFKHVRNCNRRCPLNFKRIRCKWLLVIGCRAQSNSSCK